MEAMKKTLTCVLSICFFGLVLPGVYGHSEQFPAEERVEYYATISLRESPYPDFKGVVRLGEKEAMRRNHYRLYYDEQFRLVRIGFYLGNRLREPNHTANYFFTTPVQQLTYRDGQEIRTFSDRFGNAVSQRGAFREVYQLDEQGRRTGLHFEDESGNRIENDWGIAHYTWEHQPDGSVIEQRFDLTGALQSLRPGFPFYTIRLYYEFHGSLALMQNIDKQGNLVNNESGVAQDKLLFDRAGKWYGWRVLDKDHQLKSGNGPNVARGINIPDRYGYETSVRYEDDRGQDRKNAYGFWGSKRIYDRFGNYDYTHFTDSTGQPGLNTETGYCYAEYTWDRAGFKRVKTELLDTRRRPVLHAKSGFSTITYSYDEHDNLIRVTYLGLNGEMVNRTDNGLAYIEHTYDERHKRKETRRFNKAGEEIE
ncbi:hypothetical protein CRP01_37835 [Flavilitoribacter nigricans DSM 23189 = NBRC 102662]|uniref:Uncharacterized protein n=2 Tax=Flavilitoribacter TaxID=2762562 RepID=A0A2D0MYI0_FLAN2|nr:hypothetical protein CRP01_37835 [Flavilitoribacter nigricans DSM 23189 = NBRC 102662]